MASTSFDNIPPSVYEDVSSSVTPNSSRFSANKLVCRKYPDGKVTCYIEGKFLYAPTSGYFNTIFTLSNPIKPSTNDAFGVGVMINEIGVMPVKIITAVELSVKSNGFSANSYATIIAEWYVPTT